MNQFNATYEQQEEFWSSVKRMLLLWGIAEADAERRVCSLWEQTWYTTDPKPSPDFYAGEPIRAAQELSLLGRNYDQEKMRKSYIKLNTIFASDVI